MSCILIQDLVVGECWCKSLENIIKIAMAMSNKGKMLVSAMQSALAPQNSSGMNYKSISSLKSQLLKCMLYSSIVRRETHRDGCRVNDNDVCERLQCQIKSL